MGANKSKENKSRNLPPNQPAARGNTERDIKDVLLLYRSGDNKQRRVVRSFRDALIRTGEPLINIYKEIDITENEAFLTEDWQWLAQLNNVVLIRLSPDGMADLERIIREKRFVSNEGVLHDKVMAVSFGRNLPQGWLPADVRRHARDQKDFCFGFENETTLSAEDFESESAQGKMNSLVQAIVAAR